MRSITGTAPSGPVSDVEPNIARSGGGLRGLTWLTWRQHRWLVAITALAVLVEAAVMWATSGTIRSHSPCPAGNSACVLRLIHYGPMADWQLTLVMVLPGFVAAFWGAPLIAQEYEQRTHLLAWAQDITPRRWLAAKMTLLTAVSVVLAITLGTAAQQMAHTRNAVMPPDTVNMFTSAYFEASPELVAAYTICALALGTAVGAVTRRLVPAMAVTLAVFAGTRLLVRDALRPHYLPPKIALGGLDETPNTGPDAFILGTPTYADATGHPTQAPSQCLSIVSDTPKQFDRCMRDHGITNSLLHYQPGSRIPTFQLIEAGAFVALAVIFLAVAAYRMRRI